MGESWEIRYDFTAEDNASPVIRNLTDNIEEAGKATEKTSKSVNDMGGAFSTAGRATSAFARVMVISGVSTEETAREMQDFGIILSGVGTVQKTVIPIIMKADLAYKALAASATLAAAAQAIALTAGVALIAIALFAFIEDWHGIRTTWVNFMEGMREAVYGWGNAVLEVGTTISSAWRKMWIGLVNDAINWGVELVEAVHDAVNKVIEEIKRVTGVGSLGKIGIGDISLEIPAMAEGGYSSIPLELWNVWKL
jgi:hypothetical protein